MSLVLVNRFQALLRQDSGGHHTAVQNAIDVFRDRWGGRFINKLSSDTIEQEMEMCDSRSVLSAARAESPIYIEIRPMKKSFDDLYAQLSEGEFCLSVTEVAKYIFSEEMLVPEHAIFVCGGSRCLVVPSSDPDLRWRTLILKGQERIIPTLTLATEERQPRIELNAIEPGAFVANAYVPIGVLSSGE